MAAIPVRFKRATWAAWDETAWARLSSGSEHSAESSSAVDSVSPDLSDLVDSFIESTDGDESDVGVRDGRWEMEEEEVKGEEAVVGKERLVGYLKGSGEADRIREVVEKVVGGVVGLGLAGFKRRLMTRLREEGLDAGLCKSRWERSGHVPSGDYEYVDVILDNGARYIVEAGLASEFGIARSTRQYAALLDALPPVFVGTPESLRGLARVMCAAAKASMCARGMHVPPWRRKGYAQRKWFGPHKRTTNESSAREGGGGFACAARTVGFTERVRAER
ncbi:hypothetical protein QJS04_geneDACA024139 [Acorus gramineus]|uniref:DUF506 family protein n=1 Tax=Acorus gramineus TaxID=55184 RepID=A0AAV8ZWN0_ACOGR|nr:hypothetical protein QJS04_geneDACA024139 [Acorus gramineus]